MAAAAQKVTKCRHVASCIIMMSSHVILSFCFLLWAHMLCILEHVFLLLWSDGETSRKLRLKCVSLRIRVQSQNNPQQEVSQFKTRAEIQTLQTDHHALWPAAIDVFPCSVITEVLTSHYEPWHPVAADHSFTFWMFVYPDCTQKPVSTSASAHGHRSCAHVSSQMHESVKNQK